MYVYVALSYYEWQHMKSTEEIPPDIAAKQSRIRDWLYPQIKMRLPPHTYMNEPIYAFLEKPKKCWPAKRALLKVQVPPHRIVTFDDYGYVHLLNTIGNGYHDFLAFNRKESDASHTEEECISSYERMFDLTTPRQHSWVGKPQPQAFIPHLTIDMVKKVYIYRNNKRLRRRLYIH